jgi:hypothetical protein
MARCGQRCRLVVFGEAGDGEVHFHEASELAPEPASSTSSDTVPARPSLSNDCTHSTAPLPSRRPTAASSTASQTRQNPTSTAAPNCCSHPSSSSSASRSLSRPHASTARYDCVLAPYARSRPHPSPVGHGAASKPSRLAPSVDPRCYHSHHLARHTAITSGSRALSRDSYPHRVTLPLISLSNRGREMSEHGRRPREPCTRNMPSRPRRRLWPARTINRRGGSDRIDARSLPSQVPGSNSTGT